MHVPILMRHRIILALCFSALLLADTPTATLTGTVFDNSGGAIAGATVTIRNESNAVSRSTITNASGVYEIPGLPAASYTLTASASQFKTVERSAFTLRAGGQTRIDVTLAVGESRESVVVSEAAPLVESQSASAMTVVDAGQVQELPSDGRQLQNLALIVPGVTAG